MRCPFCHGKLLSPDNHCPTCQRDISFSAKLLKSAELLCHEGDLAAKHHRYKRAVEYYQLALKYVDNPEVLNRCVRIEKKSNLIRVTGLTVLTLIFLSTSFLFVLAIKKRMSTAQTIPNRFVMIQTDHRTIRMVRTAYLKHQWEKAWTYMKSVNKNPDWRWAVQERTRDIERRYLTSKLEEAQLARAAKEHHKYQAILVLLARRGLDTPDQMVFRLRRAEGHSLFISLRESEASEREAILEEVIALFQSWEYQHIYYVDDCLYQLGRINESQGDVQSAMDCYRLLLEKCPQGQWYWSDTKMRLKRLVTVRR